MKTIREWNIKEPDQQIGLQSNSQLSRKLLRLTILCQMSLISVIAQAGPTMTIPQVPLILSTPLHPQVLFAIGNSQSMDGNLSGAIMTGSGSLALTLGSLSNSSSPLNYLVPAGFTPPLQAANASGMAPYTVSQTLNLADNSASRLNTAKGAVLNIIQDYMQSSDFALATFRTSSVAPYKTWVYYMSPAGSDFIFTNDNTNKTKRYVNNPCYKYTSASATVASNCAAIDGYYTASAIDSNLYMQIGASSDDPDINDVLYAGAGFPGVFLAYSGPSPASPYPPNFSVANYNSGNVLISYSKAIPSLNGFKTSPTNAGYVPYSQQVMYVQRGFGYYGTQAANTGNIDVPMTTAGSSPTNTSVTNAVNLFVPDLKPETNSAITPEIKSIATQSPIAGLMTKANSYLSTLSPTSGNGCPQTKYVILISDGLPTQDLSGKLWPPLGSAAAAGYGITATFNSDGSLNSTNCQAVTDAISAIKTLKANGIKTYIVGLGAGVSSSLNPQAAATLKAMAVAGGTQDYYPATDPDSLSTQLSSILSSIQDGAYSISAAAVSSTRLTSNSAAYQASFISNDAPYLDWTGDIAAMSLDPNTGVPSSAPLWSAKPLLDTLVAGSGWSSGRDIVTWDPVAGKGVPFVWDNINAAQKLLLQPSDTLGSKRLEYIRGSSALEVRNGGTFRNRSHALGDIIDSQVLYVGPPIEPYLSASYVAFAKAQASRAPVIYVGANDGMLHAFDATTGNELFAYIPNSVIKNLINLTQPIYNQSHLYFVDGSPTSADIQFNDSTWHTVLAGSEGGGGNSIFALDVTNPSSLNSESAVAQAVLWEFTDIDMGLTYSTPQIARIGASSPTAAVFFGNGYNSTTNSAVFYALNPETGAVIKKINLCLVAPTACNILQPQGLSSVSYGQVDGFQDAPISAVYAGDLQGNLWEIDVSNASPALWTARLMFQARDAGGAVQPITTAPVVSLHPSYPRFQGSFVMFGTGRLLMTNDLLDTQTQTIYGIWDKYATTTTYTRANLQQQTLTLVNSGSSGFSGSILTASSNTVNWSNKVGWYNDLPTAGQRVVTTPDILNGAFVTVLNTPPLAACGNTFSSMLLELNYLTGGAPIRPLLDLNNDKKLDSNDKYGGGFAAGVDLGNNYSNAPVLIGPNKNNNMIIMTTQTNGSQTLTINPVTNPKRMGWWLLP